ncbi:helix-hairpin-helix domain-containing protein [Vibrio sp. FNV 38]|nr:helix-hairpin-helix domain-containing protein [Vibrio sp. FNV 38]
MTQSLSKILIILSLSIFTVSLSHANSKQEQYEGIDISVNINTASAEELATLLSGVGEQKAQAIVDYREKNGEFESTEQLTQVKGVGPALLKKNAQRIQL